jgi:hypothetical protein
VVLLLIATACQSKTTTGSGSGSGTAAPVKERTTLDIKLPAVSGKPPVKTTAPLDKAQLAQLAKLTFPEFTLEVTDYPTSVAIRQRATLRPKMSVNIAISPCTEQLSCTPMSLDAWRKDEPALKAKVDPDLVNRPDSIFEIGETSIGGTPAMFVYQAGQFFGKNELGNPASSYSNAYTLHYNDGVNLLRVTVSYSDSPRTTLQDMLGALPRPFLERVATAFLDAYGQAWR